MSRTNAKRRAAQLRKLDALAEFWIDLTRGQSSADALNVLEAMCLDDDPSNTAAWKLARRLGSDDLDQTYRHLVTLCWEAWILRGELTTLIPPALCLRRALMVIGDELDGNNPFAPRWWSSAVTVEGPDRPC